MTTLDRLLLAATVTGLAAVVWRVEQLRGEVTDKRIDSAALALHGWGRDQRNRMPAEVAAALDGAWPGQTQGRTLHDFETRHGTHWNGELSDLAAILRRVRAKGGPA